MAEEKTNVMRLLEQKKVPYTPRQYDVSDGALDGVTAANRLGVAPETCFKTLVTVGGSKKNHVFVIPVEKELDLKAAAKAVGEKSIAMIAQKELLLSHRHEKALSHRPGRLGGNSGGNDRLCRENRPAGDPVSPSPGRFCGGGVCSGQ